MLHKLARYKDGKLQSIAPLKMRKKVIRDMQRSAQKTNTGIVHSVWTVDNNGNKVKQIFKVLA